MALMLTLNDNNNDLNYIMFLENVHIKATSMQLYRRIFFEVI